MKASKFKTHKGLKEKLGSGWSLSLGAADRRLGLRQQIGGRAAATCARLDAQQFPRDGGTQHGGSRSLTQQQMAGLATRQQQIAGRRECFLAS